MPITYGIIPLGQRPSASTGEMSLRSGQPAGAVVLEIRPLCSLAICSAGPRTMSSPMAKPLTTP